MNKTTKKGVILAITAIMLIVISLLALVALFVMTQEARVAEHKIKRIRAYYAAKAGLVYAFEMINRGSATATTVPPLDVGDVTVSFSGTQGTGPNDTDTISATITY
jgi:Tfp pilus assembly protein PilX